MAATTTAALSELLPGAESDILIYLAGTVDSALENDENLQDVLSELLISYELASDEEAAAICANLSSKLANHTDAEESSHTPMKVRSTPSACVSLAGRLALFPKLVKFALDLEAA